MPTYLCALKLLILITTFQGHQIIESILLQRRIFFFLEITSNTYKITIVSRKIQDDYVMPNHIFSVGKIYLFAGNCLKCIQN